jgi:hypothetical protein
MPNHCFQTLSVTGPTEDVNAFHARVEGAKSIADAFLPFPKELEGEEVKNADGEVIGRVFTDEGYAWTINNWGTKWGDYDTDIISPPSDTDGEGHVSYSFTSAWSPFDTGLRKISEMFPTLLFSLTYKEEGNDYIGAAYIRQGRVFSADVNDSSMMPEMPEPDDDGYEDWDAYYEAIDALVDKCEEDAAQLMKDFDEEVKMFGEEVSA